MAKKNPHHQILDLAIKKLKARNPYNGYGLCAATEDAEGEILQEMDNVGSPHVRELEKKRDNIAKRMDEITEKIKALEAEYDDLDVQHDDAINDIDEADNEFENDRQDVQDARAAICAAISEGLKSNARLTWMDYLGDWLVYKGHATEAQLDTPAGKEKLRTTRIAWAKHLKKHFD